LMGSGSSALVIYIHSLLKDAPAIKLVHFYKIVHKNESCWLLVRFPKPVSTS
jgi:hypothetical protein